MELRTEERRQSSSELEKLVYDALVASNRKAYLLDYHFRPQGQEWPDDWHFDTGLVLHELQPWWEADQEEAAALHSLPGEDASRESHISRDLRNDFLEYCGIRRCHNATKASGATYKRNRLPGPKASALPDRRTTPQNSLSFEDYHSLVVTNARNYFNCFNEPQDAANDLALDALAETIVNPVSWEAVTREMLHEGAEQFLERLWGMHQANKYIARMGLLQPDGLSCEEFAEDNYEYPQQEEAQYKEIWHRVCRSGNSASIIFPAPRVGRSFSRLLSHLVAAIDYNVRKGGRTLKDCFAALDRLTREVEGELPVVKNAIKDTPKIILRRKRQAEAWGLTLEHLSLTRDTQGAELLEFANKHTRASEGASTGPGGDALAESWNSSAQPKAVSIEFIDYRNSVVALAGLYAESIRTGQDGPSDMHLHALVDDILEPGPGQTVDIETLDKAVGQLKYRLAVMHQVNRYVEYMGLSQPDGLSCEKFDDAKYTRTNQKEPLFAEITEQMSKSRYMVLFPKPSPKGGRYFSRPCIYLKAAIDCTVRTGSRNLADCFKALDQLTQQVDEELQATKELLKDLPAIQSKRQRVAEAFGTTLRSLLPEPESG